jgi:hydroxyacylglutathione hydrolase
MTVYPIPAFTDNYIWAIIDAKTGVFDCVDPGDCAPVIEFARQKQLSLRTILLTHHHHDHIGGVKDLVNAYPSCQIYGPADARIPHITHVVHEHQTIRVGNCQFRILFNPGHTSTHISYYEPKQEWLFCGDTLFSAGCGRVFDGTMEQLHRSILLFKELPRTTKVFPAHEYTRQNLRFAQTVEPGNQVISQYLKTLEAPSCSLPSTMDLELSINPFLRTDQSEVIAYALGNGAVTGDSLDVFTELRNKKDTFQ